MNEKRRGNVDNLKHFSKEYQPSPENKSKGHRLAKEKREAQKTAAEMLIAKLAEKDVESGLTNKEVIVDVLNNIAKMGNVKAMTLLFKLIGELDDTNKVNVLSQVQKIFVNKEDEKNVNKHIDGIING